MGPRLKLFIAPKNKKERTRLKFKKRSSAPEVAPQLTSEKERSEVASVDFERGPSWSPISPVGSPSSKTVPPLTLEKERSEVASVNFQRGPSCSPISLVDNEDDSIRNVEGCEVVQASLKTQDSPETNGTAIAVASLVSTELSGTNHSNPNRVAGILGETEESSATVSVSAAMNPPYSLTPMSIATKPNPDPAKAEGSIDQEMAMDTNSAVESAEPSNEDMDVDFVQVAESPESVPPSPLRAAAPHRLANPDSFANKLDCTYAFYIEGRYEYWTMNLDKAQICGVVDFLKGKPKDKWVKIVLQLMEDTRTHGNFERLVRKDGEEAVKAKDRVISVTQHLDSVLEYCKKSSEVKDAPIGWIHLRDCRDRKKEVWLVCQNWKLSDLK